MFSVQTLPSQEATNEPDMEVSPVEGQDTATVPVQFLRNALWYYDNYSIQRDLAEARQRSLQECLDSLSACASEQSTASSEIAQLNITIGRWRTATITLGVTAATLGGFIWFVAQ